jgi:hypothetical protein
MQNIEAGDGAACAAAPSSHPLLDELRGNCHTYVIIMRKEAQIPFFDP